MCCLSFNARCLVFGCALWVNVLMLFGLVYGKCCCLLGYVWCLLCVIVRCCLLLYAVVCCCVLLFVVVCVDRLL